MSENAFRDFKVPYLEAIQKIPGDTASEKFRWIGTLAKQPNAVQYFEQFSPELLPLLRVQIAVKHKRHEDITSALKSNESTIVSRALKASWFFDGRHEIVDVAYFHEQIFPFISVRTRNRIVKTLARRIKNPVFAQKMFRAVTLTYNIETALLLIVACDVNFIFKTLMDMNRLPSVKILKKIFFKNRILGESLFVFLVMRCMHNVSELKELFTKYKYFLPKIIKKHPDFLLHINSSLINKSQILISNKNAKRFLQNALEYVIDNPEPYFDIIPKHIFNAVLMKKFPDLVNNPILHEYYRKEIFQILINYPEDRNLELYLKTYRDICNGKLVDIEYVTPFVLRLLPAKKRIELAIKKINSNSFSETVNCNKTWICYLAAKKATSVIKLRLNQALDFFDKLSYILKMIYACEVNNDEDELCNTLKYIIHKGYLMNDNVTIYKQGIRIIVNAFKPLYLSERNGSLLYHIIRMFYEKHGYVEQDILYHLIIHRLIYHNSIEDLIEMLLKTNDNYASIYIVSLVPIGYLQYYKQFLVIFINIIQQKYAISWENKLQQEVVKEQTRKQHKDKQRQKSKRKSKKRRNQSKKEQGEIREEKLHRSLASVQEERLKNGEKYVLCWLAVGMYTLRSAREETGKSDLELMSITKYPWFMNAIYTIMHLQTNFPSRSLMRRFLHKYEPELYRSWFLPNTSENIANVISGAALCLLKQDSQSVLDNWEAYLIDCKKYYRYKNVQHFVRATRWYKDIPIKFVERCISDLHGEDAEEMSSALIILSLLFDSNSLTNLINPLVLARLEVAMDKHKFGHILLFIFNQMF